MELLSITGGKYGRLFCLGLLLLVVGCANGQQGIILLELYRLHCPIVSTIVLI